MNAWTERPQKRGIGCFAKGCLLFLTLGILLIVVGIGGSFWGLRHLYLSDKPAPIPEASAPSEPGPATPGERNVTPANETTAAVHERLDAFKTAARAHEQTGVE